MSARAIAIALGFLLAFVAGGAAAADAPNPFDHPPVPKGPEVPTVGAGAPSPDDLLDVPVDGLPDPQNLPSAPSQTNVPAPPPTTPDVPAVPVPGGPTAPMGLPGGVPSAPLPVLPAHDLPDAGARAPPCAAQPCEAPPDAQPEWQGNTDAPANFGEAAASLEPSLRMPALEELGRESRGDDAAAVEAPRPVGPQSGFHGPLAPAPRFQEKAWDAVWLVSGFVLPLIPVWPLFRRLSRGDVLENPTRRRVLQSLQTRPGLTAGRLARELSIDPSTAQHHLETLRRFGFVEARTVGRRRLHYPSGLPGGEPERTLWAALNSEKTRLVLESLAAQPRASLREMARATGLARSTVGWHVQRLRRLQLLGPDQVPPPAVLALLARSP